MMADSQEGSPTGCSLRCLGQVLDVLLDPNRRIVDDTSLQRLLEYCKTIFNDEDIFKEEEGLQHVFDFIKACCVKEPNDFDPSALTFALQLVRCMSPNEKLLNRLMESQEHTEGGSDRGLLVQLLKRASDAEFFSDPCMKEVWLIAQRELTDRDAGRTVCIQTDAPRIAMDLLKDSSMFVMKASQKFLADMLISQYSDSHGEIMQESGCSKMADCERPIQDDTRISGAEGDGRQEIPDEQPQIAVTNDGEGTGGLLGKEQDCHENGRNKMADTQATMEGDARISGVERVGDDTVKRKLREDDAEKESGRYTQKKFKLSASYAESTGDLEIFELCEGLMATENAASILTILLLDLQSSDSDQVQKLLQTTHASNNSKKAIQSLGVFRCILQDACERGLESKGLHLLRAVAMSGRCKQVLSKEGQLCEKLCDDVVEFLVRLLHLESKECSSLTLSLLTELESLPCDLMKKGLMKPAIHLSTSIVKLCSILQQRSQSYAASALNCCLSVILSPACIMMKRRPQLKDVYLDEDILEEMRSRMISGGHTASIVCTALSGLGEIVKEKDCHQILNVGQVFHLAVLLLQAVTSSTENINQSKGLKAEYKALIGSRKILTSLLDLAQASLKEHCHSSDIWLLVDLICKTLKNPDAEYQVVLKILTSIPELVFTAMATEKHPVFIENTKREALLTEVGYAIQKRMCNIEWEVRDSTIVCVRELLKKDSGTVQEWLMRNSLHRRLWESLADSESYVRSSTLQSLPVLVGCKALWEDVQTSNHVTQEAMIANVTEVIKSDSEAFPRRAAMGCLLTWLQHESWMQEAIHNTITKDITEKSVQGATRHAVSEACPQGLHLTDGDTTAFLKDTADKPSSLPCRSGEDVQESFGDSHQEQKSPEDRLSKETGRKSPSPQNTERYMGADDIWVSPSHRQALNQVGPASFKDREESLPHVGTQSGVQVDLETSLQGQSASDAIIATACSKDDANELSRLDASGSSCLQTTPQDLQSPDSRFQASPALVVDKCRTIGEMVLDAVSTATNDLDWEMKLGALKFLHFLLNQYVPGYESASESSSTFTNAGSLKHNMEEFLKVKKRKMVERVFTRTGCLAMLLQGSRDEDVSVACKACQMLQNLKVAVTILFEGSVPSVTPIKERDHCCVNEQTASHIKNEQSSHSDSGSVMPSADLGTSADTNSDIEEDSLIGELLERDWIGLLNHREEENVEGPVSFMMDILAAADEKDENLLDCY